MDRKSSSMEGVCAEWNSKVVTAEKDKVESGRELGMIYEGLAIGVALFGLAMDVDRAERMAELHVKDGLSG